jgi:hypothetical protein
MSHEITAQSSQRNSNSDTVLSLDGGGSLALSATMQALLTHPNDTSIIDKQICPLRPSITGLNACTACSGFCNFLPSVPSTYSNTIRIYSSVSHENSNGHMTNTPFPSLCSPKGLTKIWFLPQLRGRCFPEKYSNKLKTGKSRAIFHKKWRKMGRYCMDQATIEGCIYIRVKCFV